MVKKKVLILGVTGMLGSMLLDYFVKSNEFDVTATCRSKKKSKLLKNKYPNANFHLLDVEKANLKSILKVIEDAEWIVNAIGVTKPYIHDDDSKEIDRAILVNAHFPYLIAEAARRTKAKVLQVATDCVYSGQKGRYIETDAHEALDVYGKTKSLGEVRGDNIYHLRCSIIGPELKGHNSLMDWFLVQSNDSEVNGYINHIWNGITTFHFAKICQGIIKNETTLPHIQHVIPGNNMNKADLLKSFAKKFKRHDIVINRIEAPNMIDRTLSTNNKKLNSELWQLAGYNTPPTIQKM